jgi:NDP-sugar pyrophosphorylase family protein
VCQLALQGITHLVICTGHLAKQIEDAFGDGQELGVSIEYSREFTPLGTAGALKLAAPLVDEESEFLVLNGDSFVEVDFHELIDFHHQKSGIATIAAIPIDNAARYGSLKLAPDGRVSGFLEKTGHEGPGTINAGVYLFKSEVLDEIPDGPSSLERDVIPKLLDRGVFAFEKHGTFIDIGTPDDYARANSISERLSALAHGRKIVSITGKVK